MTYEQLREEALKLTEEEKTRLAGELLESLRGGTDPEIEKAWIEEARRRDAEMDSGAVEGVAAEELLRRLRGQPE